MSDRAEKFLLYENFVYNSCVIWNSILNHVLSKSISESSGVVVLDLGTSKNSDLTISVPVPKHYLISHLLKCQKEGNSQHW